ncbi:MAG: hypothetical protein HY901_02220 [Deltaproteobacteria bacterium]|nr:hypothetical protein [Deltaproteobacteria bacterium]
MKIAPGSLSPLPTASTANPSTQVAAPQAPAPNRTPGGKSVDEFGEPARSRQSPFDPSTDATGLYRAMKRGVKGMGTDEKAIFAVLRDKTPEQVDSIRASYREHFSRDLDTDLRAELSFSEKTRALLEVSGDTASADALALKGSLSNLALPWSSRSKAVISLLSDRSPEQIDAIKGAYQSQFGRDLETAIEMHLDGPDLVLVHALLSGDRTQTQAATLYKAIEDGDSTALLQGLEEVNPAEISALASSYRAQVGGDLRQDVETALRGSDLQRAMGLLDGCPARSDAIRLQKALEEGDFKSICSVLEGKLPAERDAILGEFRSSTRTDFSSASSRLPEHQKALAASLLENGKLSGAEKLHLAMKGLGTDAELIRSVLQGRSRAEIDALSSEYQSRYQRELGKDLSAELSGRERFDALQALKGKPTSPQEELERLNETLAFERGGLANAASAFVMDKMTDKGERLDANTARARAEYGSAMKDGVLDPGERARLTQLLGYAEQDADLYHEAKQSAAEGIANGAQITAATVATVATGGTGAPLMVQALAAAAASSGTRVAAEALLQGKGYSWGDAGRDAAIGAVDGASTLLSAGLAKTVTGGVIETIASAGGRGLAPQVASGAVRGGVMGTIGGASSSGVRTAVDERTWTDGRDRGLKKVATSAGMGGLVGGAMGAVGGALQPLNRPVVAQQVVPTPFRDEAIDLSTYRSTEEVRKQALARFEASGQTRRLEEQVRNVLHQHPELASIPREDLMALCYYTGSGYRDLNGALRTQLLDDAYHQLSPTMKAASSALNQLPSYQGTTYRGADLASEVLAQYEPGKVVGERAFMSTASGGYASSWGSKNALFVVNVKKSAHDVSHLSFYPDEKEVLFTPGTEFKVLSKVFNQEANYGSGQTTIYLDEVVP